MAIRYVCMVHMYSSTTEADTGADVWPCKLFLVDSITNQHMRYYLLVVKDPFMFTAGGTNGTPPNAYVCVLTRTYVPYACMRMCLCDMYVFFVVVTVYAHAIVDQIISRWVGQMRDEGVTGWNSSQRDREHHTETFNFPGRGMCGR